MRVWTLSLLIAFSLAGSAANYNEIDQLKAQYEKLFDNDSDSCLTISKMMLDYYYENNLEDSSLLSELKLMYARVLGDLAFYESSLDILLEELKHTSSDTLRADIYHSIGLLYDELDKPYLANKYYFKSMLFTKDDYRKAMTYNALGDNFIFLEKHKKAIAQFNKGINILRKDSLANIQDIAVIKFAKVQSLVALGNNPEAFKIISAYDTSVLDDYPKGYYHYANGFYYQSIDNFNLSYAHFVKAAQLAEKVSYSRGLIRIYDELIHLAKSYDNYLIATEYLLKRDSVKQIVFNEHEMYKLKEHEVKYEIYKKENKINLQKAELKFNRLLIGFLAIILIVSIAAIILFILLLKKLRKSNIQLKEKNDKIEFLHNELAHRVKNNLQLLSSLISLQARTIDNEEVKNELRVVQNRVKSIGVLYNGLGNDNNKRNFRDYVNDIYLNIKKSSYLEETMPEIKFTNNIEEVGLNVSEKMLLALIINELFTNFFKHGATAETPELVVKLNVNERGQKEFLLRDNGIKNSESSLDFRPENSFGHKIIKAFAKQIDGELELSDVNGFQVKISF